MQHRMFDPANILIHRQPFIGFFRSEKTILVFGGILCEIPTRFKERIERIGFAQRGGATFWAIDMLPGCVMVQRVSGLIERNIFGEFYGELILWNRHDTAVFAVNHRDWAAPITLTRDTPITQAIIGLFGADIKRF